MNAKNSEVEVGSKPGRRWHSGPPRCFTSLFRTRHHVRSLAQMCLKIFSPLDEMLENALVKKLYRNRTCRGPYGPTLPNLMLLAILYIFLLIKKIANFAC
jgi:hypothetical protein